MDRGSCRHKRWRSCPSVQRRAVTDHGPWTMREPCLVEVSLRRARFVGGTGCVSAKPAAFLAPSSLRSLSTSRHHSYGTSSNQEFVTKGTVLLRCKELKHNKSLLLGTEPSRCLDRKKLSDPRAWVVCVRVLGCFILMPESSLTFFHLVSLCGALTNLLSIVTEAVACVQVPS